MLSSLLAFPTAAMAAPYPPSKQTAARAARRGRRAWTCGCSAAWSARAPPGPLSVQSTAQKMPVRPKCSRRPHISLMDQDDESLLHKVMVVRQHFHDAALPHGLHGDAIRQAIIFVRTAFVELEAQDKGGRCLRNDLYIPPAAQAMYLLSGGLPQPSACVKGIEELHQDFLRGEELGFSQQPRRFHRLLMPLITAVDQGHPVQGISTNTAHYVLLGVPYR